MGNYPCSEENNLRINRRIRNVALQIPCFGCRMQDGYIDIKGVIRCAKADKCNKVIHYAKAEYKHLDPDFDDITYARCGNCGQLLYKPGEQTKCPCCGFEIIWGDEPI